MKMGDFEYEGWKDLQKRLAQLKLNYPAFARECIKELAGRLYAKTVARTPVGIYKDRWVEFTTAKGKQVRFFAKAKGKLGGELRKGWTIGEIKQVGNEIHVEIINPVLYAPYVESGHRTPNHKGWVEGRFMLKTSTTELESEMPAILERKMEQYIKRMLRW